LKDILATESDEQLEIHALALLCHYTKKPDALWTSSLQWQAIAQVYQREQDIIVITATSAGKNMDAILPTLLGEDNELALIHFPLNSLITDYKCKFTAMDIPYDVYDHHKTHINPRWARSYFQPMSHCELLWGNDFFRWPRRREELS
jgi:hypothetical protein